MDLAIIFRNIYFKMINVSWKFILISTLSLILFLTLTLPIIEPQTFTSNMDSFWYTMTALPTIGYGDLSPHTVKGRLFAVFFVHILGLGLFTTLMTKLIEGVVSYKHKKEGGELMYTGENHIVIIDWSHKAENAVKAILKKNKNQEVVVIDTIDKLEHVNGNVHYVKGEASSCEVLERANIAKARAVLIFADDRIDSQMLTDGKSLMIATAVERVAPLAHTTVEIEREEHEALFTHVNVDNFIISNETIAKMVVNSVI
jgi:voltage-gated potassium channel